MTTGTLEGMTVYEVESCNCGHGPSISVEVGTPGLFGRRKKRHVVARNSDGSTTVSIGSAGGMFNLVTVNNSHQCDIDVFADEDRELEPIEPGSASSYGHLAPPKPTQDWKGFFEEASARLDAAGRVGDDVLDALWVAVEETYSLGCLVDSIEHALPEMWALTSRVMRIAASSQPEIQERSAEFLKQAMWAWASSGDASGFVDAFEATPGLIPVWSALPEDFVSAVVAEAGKRSSAEVNDLLKSFGKWKWPKT